MRKFLTLILVLAAALGASAKLSQFVLRAYVQRQDYSKSEWQRQSVDSLYVSLVKNDSLVTMVPFKLMEGNDTTKFSPTGYLRMIVQGGVGDYSLILNREGYEPLRHDFKVASEGQDVVYLRSLFMEPMRQTSLREVEIVGTAVKMVMKGDTIIYDSAAFTLAEGSTLDALIRQLPGAELADDGSIKVNGKKVQSLLLNGQDFFKDDPEVALKNLPSYTVDKVKVYDKAAKDDYLTLESQRLDNTPQDENLVMDVVLKKEFSMATIMSVEGGYGPGIHNAGDPKRFDHRYLGRAFLIGFGKTYRFSAFGNVNNIKNTSKSSSSMRDWANGWNQSGEMQVAMGGFDVFYNPNKKIELTADMQYSREDIKVRTLTSSVRFYDSGNLYSRQRFEQNDLRHHLIGHAELLYLGDNVSVSVNPYVDVLRSDANTANFDVNLNRNPMDASRGAVVDSVFALRPGLEPSEELKNSITSTNYTSYKGHSPGFPDWVDAGVNFRANFAPKSVRGKFLLYGNVTNRSTDSKFGRIYYQTLADASGNPVRREQWTDEHNSNTNASTSLRFDWNKRVIGETRMNTFAVTPAVGWTLERKANDGAMEYDLLLQNIDPASRPLPSVTAPENINPIIDGQNTVNSLFLNNGARAIAIVSFRSEMIAPTDSGRNLSYYVSLTANHTQYFRHLSYNKPYLADEPLHYRLNDSDGAQQIYGNVSISTNNKTRYAYFSVAYDYYNSLVNMFTMVPTTNSSDPLNIYLGPEAGLSLPKQQHHDVSLWMNYYGKQRHDGASLNAHYYIARNSTAQTAVFNPATGVTTHRPISVNGNWWASANGSYYFQFGPNERWTANISANYSHVNSVDYVSASYEPLRSVVRTDRVGGDVNLSYRLTNGTKFFVGASTNWHHSGSPREGFTALSTTTSSVKAGINFYLPWQIEGETTLNADFRRGFDDPSLNTTQWVWNASVQKSILKGDLTFKIVAVDILSQLSNVTISTNAQGRVEVWTNNLPRYAMLTVAYRFSFTPKVLQSPN